MRGKDIFNSSHAFIIAEAGVNHNGHFELAKKLIDSAKEAGVDAVKFQTFKAENTVSIFAKKAAYQKKGIKKSISQFDLIKELELSYGSFVKLKKYCDKRKIMFLSTPFDFESVDFLENLVPAYKVGSGEITNLFFLKYIAKKGKPIILSTGMSTLGEIEEAINTILPILNSQYPQLPNKFPPLSLLHCISNYPADYSEVNLNAMLTLKEAFKLPTGYSDHTLGIEVPIAAVALGARILEKHFTLNKNLPGPDHAASLEPNELKAMVNAIRNIEKSFGDYVKKPTRNELEISEVTRRSIVAARNIKAGEIVNEPDVLIKRPGLGIKPKFRDIIIGMKLTREIKKDEFFKWEHFK